VPVIGALSYLHEHGYVHGRLKPSNILSAGERLKISSDGIRKNGDSNGLPEVRGPYDAPETIAGRLSPAADVWALGATLVEILTQQLPVENGAGEPDLPETLPEEFREMAAHCLEPDPERRWNLPRISAQLNPAVPLPGRVLAMPPRREAPSPEPGAPQRRYSTSLIGIVLAAVVILAGTLFFRSRPTRTPLAPAPSEASREVTPAPPAQNEEKPSPAGRVRGRVATDSRPDISRQARNTIQGTVKVRVAVRVDPSGRVVETKLDTPRVSRYFGNACLQAARRWRFHPPTVEGRAVPSSWILEFDFTRSGTAVRSREIS
jgi:TonB family protein